ncbi:MAG: HepT-like ribonuclease domain-containing protein [Dehalococcoidia bacterium]
MLVYARRVAAKTAGLTRAEFDADENLQLALVYLLQVVGEAASKLSKEERERHVEVPWRTIIGMRHVVVHDYLRVDVDVVWETVTGGIPTLLGQLESMVAASDTDQAAP